MESSDFSQFNISTHQRNITKLYFTQRFLTNIWSLTKLEMLLHRRCMTDRFEIVCCQTTNLKKRQLKSDGDDGKKATGTI